MSAIRKWWVVFRNPEARIDFGDDVYLGPGCGVHAPFGGELVIGSRVEFRRGVRIELARDAKLTIGEGTRFTYYVVIQCGRKIEIGARCVFAQAALVVDGNHRFRDLTRPILEQGYDLRALRIDDDVAVMAKCTVLANVGRRSFIGANSVVSRDLPPYVVAVGAPAHPIDYFGPEGAEPVEPSASRSDRSG
ncbi:MAG TPA: acyltransferase [Solirubrobacterales bacterium]|nr:acyltransferase [Solirubrobacterales bacterium]